jgi:hypothetical protein
MRAQRDRRIAIRIARRNSKNELRDKVLNHKPRVLRFAAEEIRFRVKFYGHLTEENWSPVSLKPFLPQFFYWDDKGKKEKVALN